MSVIDPGLTMSVVGQDQHPGVVVSGFHRSGTSLLAGLLHRAGVHMGDSLYGPHLSNPDGHFEHSDLVELHDAILARKGKDWQYVGETAPEMEGQDWVHMYLLAGKRQQTQLPWGMKDPRLALFSEAWRRVLPQARWLLIYRHPAECHDSFARRHSLALLLGQGERDSDLRFWQEPDLAWRMWLRYHQILMAAIGQVSAPVLVLSHQALLDDRSKNALSQISDLVGVDLEPYAGGIRRDWSARSMCQPPLDATLAQEVEAMWTRLGQGAGELADLRIHCTPSPGVVRGDKRKDLSWPALLSRLPQPLRANLQEAPDIVQEDKRPGELDFNGPKDALAQAEQANSAALRHAILSAAAQRFPDNVWLHNALGLSHRDRGELAEAEACFKRAVQLGPEFPGIWRQLAYVAGAGRRFDDALAYLRPAWPLAAGNANLLAELCLQAGNLYFKLNDNRQALLYAENAMKLRPDWPPAQEFLDKLSNTDDGRGYLAKLETAYQAGQVKADIVLPLASLLVQYGRMAEASDVAESFLAGEPGHRGVRKILVSALRGLGEYSLAQRLELTLWQETLNEPGCMERVEELNRGLGPWASQDLLEKLAGHLDRILEEPYLA